MEACLSTFHLKFPNRFKTTTLVATSKLLLLTIPWTVHHQKSIHVYSHISPLWNGSVAVKIGQSEQSFSQVLSHNSKTILWKIMLIRLQFESGNEILFSLETASDYARADKQHYFGFRCLITGFEWKDCFGLARLEMELAYLGGFCAHELIKKDLVLPPVSGILKKQFLSTLRKICFL